MTDRSYSTVSGEAKAAEPYRYTDVYEGIAEAGKYAEVVVRHHTDITDENERGALAMVARRSARLLTYLADTFELVQPMTTTVLRRRLLDHRSHECESLSQGHGPGPRHHACTDERCGCLCHNDYQPWPLTPGDRCEFCHDPIAEHSESELRSCQLDVERRGLERSGMNPSASGEMEGPK